MYSFYALLSRMKYIERWGLMRSFNSENIAEHSLMTAMIAHALAVIENKLYGGNFNPDRVGLRAVFHEASEVLTGDLPTPIKYYSKEISSAYKKVEEAAEKRLLSTLPDILTHEISQLLPLKDFLNNDNYKSENCKNDTELSENSLVKCADKLSAYVKCAEEVSLGNNEFKPALQATKEGLEQLSKKFKSVNYFLNNFVEAFSKPLDLLI